MSNLKCTYTKSCGWKCSRYIKKGDVDYCWQHAPPKTLGECSICMDKCTTKTKNTTTKCNHIFHKKCLDEWINRCQYKQIPCPMCRTIIKDGIKNDEHVVEFPTVRSETWIRVSEGIWVLPEELPNHRYYNTIVYQPLIQD